MSNYEIKKMKTKAEVQTEVTKIINKSLTASKAVEGVVRLVQLEREAVLSEIMAILDTRDVGYVRIMRHVHSLQDRNRD